MITRSERNPILTRADIPAIPNHVRDVTSVFNPGAIKFNDEYILMLRVQLRSRETFFLAARSKDGVRILPYRRRWSTSKESRRCGSGSTTCTMHGSPALKASYYIMFALDMEDACQLGLGKTNDFDSFEFLGIASNEDIRNGVLFPEKVEREVPQDGPA